MTRQYTARISGCILLFPVVAASRTGSTAAATPASTPRGAENGNAGVPIINLSFTKYIWREFFFFQLPFPNWIPTSNHLTIPLTFLHQPHPSKSTTIWMFVIVGAL
jgi:hypothetical protein